MYHASRRTRLLGLIILSGLLSWRAPNAAAGPLGSPDFGYVLIVDDRGGSTDGEIDSYHTLQDTFRSAHLTVPTAIRSDELIGEGAAVRVLVPTSGALGETWTEPGFNDSAWLAGVTGVGYDAALGSPLFPEGLWAFEGSGEDSSGNGRTGVVQTGVTFSSEVPGPNPSTSSLEMNGAGSVIVPGYRGVAGSAARTVAAWLRTTETNVTIVEWGTNATGQKWTFRVQSGSGVAGAIRVEINGGHVVGNTPVNDGLWHHVAAVLPEDASPDVEDVRLYVDGQLDADAHVGPAPSSVQPQALNTVSEVDLRIGTDFSSRTFVGLLDDVGVWAEALTAAQVDGLSRGLAALSLTDAELLQQAVGTDVESRMRGEGTSAFLRVAFTVEDPGSFDTLLLRIQYDDAFVAYLNGQEVARRNAPAVVEWNSTSLGDRPEGDAAYFDTLDVSAGLPFLTPGVNVLAIHGLNSDIDADAFLVSPHLAAESGGWVVESITESNSPGLLYLITREGVLFEVDWYAGVVTTLADLGRSLPAGVEHRLYDSVTNLPGSDLLYVLRSDRGSGAANSRDFLDTYDPSPGATAPYTLDVYRSANTGTISLSAGPAFPAFGDGPALYTIATGGSFEVYDPTVPGSAPVVLSTGRPPGTAGDLVSLTGLDADPSHLYVLQNHTGGGDADKDHVHVYDLEGGYQQSVFTMNHTGASSITESPRPRYLYTQATGGSVAHIEVAQGQNGVADFASGVSSSAQSAAWVPRTTSPGSFIYIADDRGASHLDAFDTQYLWAGGATNGLLAVPETPVAAGGGADWADSSVTDGGGWLWQLHSDGKLYRIDPDDGETVLVTDLDPPPGSADRSTYESITDVPGDSRLFILRTDRPDDAKTGGSLSALIDTWDMGGADYETDLYETTGVGVMSLSDGPPFNGGTVATGSSPAVYTISTGGSFEVLAPQEPGRIFRIREGLAGADGGGSMVSITNLPRDVDRMYVLRDRSGGDGRDRLDVLDLAGNAVFDALELNGTGAKSITDTNDGWLYTNATGGAFNLIPVDLADPTASAVYELNNGVATLQCSVTNLAGGTSPVAVFHRGDVNDDGRIQLTDGVIVLNWLFKGGPVPPCIEAADSDDNGAVNLTDAISILQYLFLGGPPPADPGPPGLGPCGPDDQGTLGCDTYTSC